MADYTEERADAVADIQEAGGVFTLSRTETTIPDPDKPWRKTADAPDTCTPHAVLTYYRKTIESQGYTAGSEDSRAILPGDMLMLIAAADPGLLFPPAPRHVLTGVDGQKYVVISVETVGPDGTPILYRVQVRK